MKLQEPWPGSQSMSLHISAALALCVSPAESWQSTSMTGSPGQGMSTQETTRDHAPWHAWGLDVALMLVCAKAFWFVCGQSCTHLHIVVNQ